VLGKLRMPDFLRKKCIFTNTTNDYIFSRKRKEYCRKLSYMMALM